MGMGRHLDSLRAPLTGTDSNRIFHGADKNFAVADVAVKSF
ncbi:hypothetical protein MTY_1299 [Moorella thermoacetica Y72]|uniref:Uncharacterized protein n=1 Tax=Moorella thermoacetica Y72 TaxID=1325331 RepID=A0A0S6UAG9_NEOTH|nr:hypothetical protein MTY_1299 [Moorella thermoacetica Y72]